MKRFLLLALGIGLGPAPLTAQLTAMRAGPNATVGVEFAKGFFDGDGLKAYTSTLRARALVPVSASAHFVLDWGVSIAGIDGAGTDATFANPQVGILLVGDDGENRAHVTVAIPIAFGVGDDDASVATGLFTDFFRPERWSDEVFGVNAGFTPSTPLGDATHLTAEVTASALIPTGDGDDAELFSRYGVGFRHDTEVLRLSGGLEGYAILSEGDLSLGERTLHRLVLAVDGLEGGPGFFLQLPMDDVLEGIDAVLGLTYTF